MKNIRFILIALLAFGLQYGVSHANIFFVDQAGFATADNGITDLQVPPTSGEEGDFEILACVTGSDGSNFFTNATPNWNNFDLGECGGLNCVMGIFTKFGPEPNNVSSECFWNTPQLVAAGAVLRYRGVSGSDPVFNYACSTGVGNMATSPQLATPSGSMVVRIYGSNELTVGSIDELPGSPEFGKIVRGFGVVSASEAANIFMYGEPFEESGTAEPVSVTFPVVDTAWRACTISLFMEGGTIVAPIPTMSEWGMIAFVIIAGSVAVFFLRRRSLAA